MASAFAHALAAVTLGKSFPEKTATPKLLLLAAFCAIFPDADVITFRFGIHYDDVLGHRGFFHSFFFCALLSVIVTSVFYRNTKLVSKEGLLIVLILFLSGASHALLDMLTNGGRGVAIFAPFDNTRYFFPWRPIKVSPIGVGRFFSHRGWEVIKSELIWIGLPCLVVLIIQKSVKK
ncbi:MAG: metal-dependent hydrolase [Bacteroidia bacterium]